MKKLVFASFIIAMLFPAFTYAGIGVGVGLGKIEMPGLKPGGTYSLPLFPVINTGTEESDYGVGIDYHEKTADYQQMWPDKSWFKFEPEEFYLNVGESKGVRVTLSIPIKTTPGDYFAYLEAHPVVKNPDTSGKVSIGVAAATRVYFSVAPSNIFQGIYYTVVFFISRNAPWTYIFLAVLAAAILIFLFRRYFKFNISIGKK